jgi:hypothetical protein
MTFLTEVRLIILEYHESPNFFPIPRNCYSFTGVIFVSDFLVEASVSEDISISVFMAEVKIQRIVYLQKPVTNRNTSNGCDCLSLSFIKNAFFLL